jgi:hypothetical protein
MTRGAYGLVESTCKDIECRNCLVTSFVPLDIDGKCIRSSGGGSVKYSFSSSFGGLSPGGVAGLVIGLLILFALIIGSGFWYWKRRNGGIGYSAVRI